MRKQAAILEANIVPFNDRVQDSILAHKTFLAHFENKTAEDMVKPYGRVWGRFLNEKAAGLKDYDKSRVDSFLKQAGSVITASASQSRSVLEKRLGETALLERDFIHEAINGNLPKGSGFQFAALDDKALRAAYKPSPGRIYANLSADQLIKVQEIVGDAALVGDDIPKLKRRLRTELPNLTKNRADTIARTEIHRVSRDVQDAYMEKNASYMKGVRYLATLDSRTCLRCGPLDGKGWATIEQVPDFANPPIHPRCRCVLVPVARSLDEILGTNLGGTKTARASMNGAVPARHTWASWITKLSKQKTIRVGSKTVKTEDFLTTIMGKARYELWKAGKIGLGNFSTKGKLIRLKDLKGLITKGTAPDPGLFRPTAFVGKKAPPPSPLAKLSPPEDRVTVTKGITPAAKKLKKLRKKKKVAKKAAAAKKKIKALTAQVDFDDATKWRKIGGQMGSNPGGLYEDIATGEQWYVKAMQETRARNEVLAAKLYEAAGVDVPHVRFAKINGDFGIASRIVPGAVQAPGALQAGSIVGVNEGFVVDAWLANWDVVGLNYDNMLVVEGAAIRLDTGGALLYRAQGAKKGAKFTSSVGELETLRNASLNPQAAKVFAGVTDQDIYDGIAKVKNVSTGQIRKLVKRWGPKGAADQDELVKKLIARRKDLAKRQAGFKLIPQPKKIPNTKKATWISADHQFKVYDPPTWDPKAGKWVHKFSLVSPEEAVSGVASGQLNVATFGFHAKRTLARAQAGKLKRRAAAGTTWKELPRSQWGSHWLKPQTTVGNGNSSASMREVRSTMSPAERRAADAWKGSSYRKMRQYQTGALKPGDSRYETIKAHVENLQAVARRSPKYLGPKGSVVWRGSELPKEIITEWLQKEQFELDSFTSSSTRRGFAESWRPYGQAEFISYLLEVRGSRTGLAIEALSDVNRGEAEILLLPGSRYKIIGVEKKRDYKGEYLHIVAEEVITKQNPRF